MQRWTNRSRPGPLALAGALLIAACSSGVSDGSPESEPDGATAIATDEVETGEPDWTGAPVNPFDLRTGDCFNEVSWIDEEQERRINITARIGCDEPHDREVYFEQEFPAPNGAPFPGEGPLTTWSTELCYDSFAEFVGEEYELSVFEIDFLQPTQETFEHPVGRHRRVTCFLYDRSGEQIVGTAKGTAE